MPVNPKIVQKIEGLEAPPKIKQILQNILEVEDANEAMETQKQIIKTYDRLLERFSKDEELKKFCDEYGNQN